MTSSDTVVVVLRGVPIGSTVVGEGDLALSPLPFELRDAEGRLVHADFVNVVASPERDEPPTVVVSRRQVNAAVASLLRPETRGGSGP